MRYTLETVETLLVMLLEHQRGVCECDLTDGGYGLCRIGQWSEGAAAGDELEIIADEVAA